MSLTHLKQQETTQRTTHTKKRQRTTQNKQDK